MLVKLGDVWVDPVKVEAIYADSQGKNTTIDLVTRSYLGSEEGRVDEYAAIINNAVGQSFGGSDEEITPEA